MDAFLQKDQIRGFEVGTVVTFSAYLRDNKLRARDLKLPVVESPPSLWGNLGGSAALDALMSTGGGLPDEDYAMSMDFKGMDFKGAGKDGKMGKGKGGKMF